MKREGSTTISLLALAISLVAVLYSTCILVYMATYLKGNNELAASLRDLARVLRTK